MDNKEFNQLFVDGKIKKVKENMRKNMREVSNKHRRKFSDEQIREMRKLHATGQCSQKDLAIKYKANKATINLIIHRKRYSDVD